MHLRGRVVLQVLLWGLGLSQSARALIIGTETPRSSLGLGLSSLYREQPDGTREQRYRYDLIDMERLLPWLRWENRIGIARDNRPRSQAVRVHEHVYEAFSGLRLAYPYFFRLGLSAGPLLQLQSTTIELATDNRASQNETRWRLGWQAQLSLDYAISKNWEVMSFFALQGRPSASKTDFCFGAAVVLNSSIRAKSASLPPTPTSPARNLPVPPPPFPLPSTDVQSTPDF